VANWKASLGDEKIKMDNKLDFKIFGVILPSQHHHQSLLPPVGHGAADVTQCYNKY